MNELNKCRIINEWRNKKMCVCVWGGGGGGVITNNHFPLLCRYIFCVIITKTQYFILNLDITYFVGGKKEINENQILFSFQFKFSLKLLYYCNL